MFRGVCGLGVSEMDHLAHKFFDRAKQYDKKNKGEKNTPTIGGLVGKRSELMSVTEIQQTLEEFFCPPDGKRNDPKGLEIVATWLGLGKHGDKKKKRKRKTFM